MLKRFLVLLLLLVAASLYGLTAQVPQVSVILDAAPGRPVVHGLEKLSAALAAKKISAETVSSVAQAKGSLLIVAGLSKGEGPAAAMLAAGKHAVPDSAEALTIWKTRSGGKTAWVLSGSDDRGLQYALLDVADRIGWSTGADPFSRVRPVTESAHLRERAIVIYTMNRAYWESRFYNEDYWKKYLDMMAADRLNMLEVGFGFENGGFLAPAYPYFFNVPEYPGIRMGDLTAGQQKKNLDAFNRLIELCHERGIGFRVGFWDHIYRGGYQSNKDMPDQVNSQVQGVTPENMIAYTQVALAKFIELVPHLDGILFRAHDESGLKKGEQLLFWKSVFDMLQQKKWALPVDLHAKEVSDTIVHEGESRGLTIRMSTKYWMEQMGLPYHITHTNRITDNSYRRHSYGDMLNYDEQYPVFYRIWGGTTRVLLWGDPDYVRRFAPTTGIHGGAGFGVNEPLTTKMHAQPHDAVPFALLKPDRQYYKYEFERYWHFYQTFGRIGYNPQTPSEVWDEDFNRRFGKQAGPAVEKMMHTSGQVLPRIVASCFPLVGFPIASGWAEKQHMGDLPDYAKTTPSDVQQFASFDDEAKLLLEKGETAKIRPSRNSLWFQLLSERIDRLIAEAEKAPGGSGNKELFSTITDAKILSNLALYHARRIPAAVSYRLYERTHNGIALNDAIRYEKSAIEAWKMIVAAAEGVYADTLRMGPRTRTLVGSWKQELGDLQAGLAKLEAIKPDSMSMEPLYEPAPDRDYSTLFTISHQPLSTAKAGAGLTVQIRVKAANGLQSVKLLYRDMNQYKEFETLDMKPVAGNLFSAVIPGSSITGKWDLQYLFEVMDKQHHGMIWPDLDKETPYVIVKVNR